MTKIFLILINLLFSNGIEYGPYIDILTDTTLSLKYFLKNPKQSWFSWGIYPKCDMYLTYFAPQKRITTNIYGLQSDKEYCYNIYLEVDNSTFSYIASSSTFRPFTKSTTTEFNFLVFTDLNKNYQEIFDTLNIAIDSKTNLVIFYGEIGEDEELQYFSRYNKFISKIPFYLPLIENHIEETTKNPKKLFQNLFRFSYNGDPPHYYYVDISNARFIFVDLLKSRINRNFYLKQKEWLENVALASEKDWVFLITNYELDNEQTTPKHFLFKEILKKQKIDLIVEFGKLSYSRYKKYIDDEIMIVSIGKNKENLNLDNLDFYSNLSGVLKVTISSRKMELYYLNQNKTIDHLVFQK